MQIKFELPESIAQGLETKWTDLTRAALERQIGRARRLSKQKEAMRSMSRNRGRLPTSLTRPRTAN